MRQIGFIAGKDGEIVKYDPKVHIVRGILKAAPLTRHQRATLYFKALRYVESLLTEVGFRPIADPGHGAFTLEMGNFMLEMTVQQAPRVAHVTSYPGYVYDPEKVTAKVSMACPTDPRDYVIRAIATLPNLRTCQPVYIVVDKDSTDVLKDSFMSILRAAHTLIQMDAATLRRIKEVIARRNIEKDFERLRSQDKELTEGG